MDVVLGGLKDRKAFNMLRTEATKTGPVFFFILNSFIKFQQALTKRS